MLIHCFQDKHYRRRRRRRRQNSQIRLCRLSNRSIDGR